MARLPSDILMTEYHASRSSSGVKAQARREGFLKLYLGHSKNGSVLVPAQLFVKAGPWRFFQPSFFGPPLIAFGIEPGRHVANFSIDVASPRGRRSSRLLVRIVSNDRARTFDDGAQLYRCTVEGPNDLAHYAAGRCRPLPDHDFRLQLFHHTNPGAYASICASHELWSSSWNLQGTRQLKNVSYVYFTSMPTIRANDDLLHIAMASTGTISFQTTSARPKEEVLDLKVYRESTSGRTSTLAVEVPSTALAPPHLLYHPAVFANPAYYEVVGPEIFRVGLAAGTKLAIPRKIATVVATHLKTFDYIVVGDASELSGLAAPYDEEETTHVMHLERLASGLDLFGFWQANANSDQGRTFEPRHLEQPTY
jgi:hypothetical protein